MDLGIFNKNKRFQLDEIPLYVFLKEIITSIYVSCNFENQNWEMNMQTL